MKAAKTVKTEAIIIPKYSTRARKKIWLTFDDGPHPKNTDVVLSTLDKLKIKATFFVVGENAKKLATVVKRVFDAGHRIGNHSFTHPDLTKLTAARVREEIQKTEDLILPYLGTEKLFRPPYGAHNAMVDGVIKQLGYRSIFWTVDTLDWDAKYQPKKWIEHGLEQIKSRDDCRVLNHDIHKTTSDNLGTFIEQINKIGNAGFESPDTL